MATNTRDAVDKPLSGVPPSFSFFWLDTATDEYFKFIDNYSDKLGINGRSWSFYDSKPGFLNILKTIKSTEKIILIVSGSLALELLPSIHGLEQLHSVHIFCRSIPKYASLADTYQKVKSIQSSSNRLYQDLRATIEVIQAEEAGKLSIFSPPHRRSI